MRRRAYAVGIFLMISGTCLQGCVAVLGVGTAGNLYFDKEHANILVTEDERFVAGCDYIKDVEETSWRGEAGFGRIIADLTHETHESGGDTLIIRRKYRGFMKSSASGTAYRCSTIDNSSIGAK